jgi:hypothetical protein
MGLMVRQSKRILVVILVIITNISNAEEHLFSNLNQGKLLLLKNNGVCSFSAPQKIISFQKKDVDFDQVWIRSD